MVLGEIFSGVLYFITDIFYWAKWAASYGALLFRKRTRRRRFDLYDFESDEPEKAGILVPEEERMLESPFPEEHLDEAADEIFMYGVNSKSECVILRLSRACNEMAEAWIYLKLADGRRYKLQDTSGYQRSFGDKCTIFSCGGLQMYYMSPMRRWRIVYCGMLSKIENGEEKEPVFVKFSFLWTASSEVYDCASDLEIRATADAMAKAEWTSPLPPVNKLAETLNFYCQSGVITGIVSAEDLPDTEVYLYGERMRHISKSSYLVGCKFKQILGFVPENGLVVHLGKASVPNTFHNLPFGFIVHPNGSLHSLDDGDMITRMSGSADYSKNLTAMFKAGDKQYDLTGDFFGSGICFMSENGWNGYLELRSVEFEVDNLKGIGIILSGKVFQLPERRIRRIPPVFHSEKPLTVNFTDEISHLAELTGGKGSSLGKLTKLSNKVKSFIVPKGIVVTTAAYSEFLTSEITQKIENLKDVIYGNVKGNTQEACKIVTSAIEKAYLPSKITIEIEERLNTLFGGKTNQHKFAVRSSATGEDTDQMSAAGQMDTFLGVQGLKEIFAAIKKCWASQFRYIAIEYKRQNGQILNSPMAVVIQEMVDCEAAGVLFTCDPVTNNPSVLVITGNYGLGESVVSGSEEPDTVVLQRLQDGAVKLKSVTIGIKQRKIIVPKDDSVTTLNMNATTVTEDVPEDKRKKCCISKEMAEKLGKIALKIENYYKSPRDIEWGIRNGAIYMFQSRPVTTGVALTDYEIKHEFDGPLRCDGEYFAPRDVLTGATSPLGWDVICRYFALTFQRKSMTKKQRNNFLQSKYFPVGVVPFYNHCMVTVVDMVSRLDDTDSLMGQSLQIGLFGRLFDDPGIKTLAKYRKKSTVKPSFTSYVDFFKNLFFSGYGIEDLKKKLFSYEFPTEKCRTSIATFDEVMHSCSNHNEVFLKHTTCSEMSSFWNMNIIATLGKSKGCIGNEVYSDFSKLLSSVSNVESADVPSSMQDLAYSIVKEVKSEVFKAMSVEAAKEWLETSSGMAGFKFRQFLKRHGHRCLKEFDIHSQPWGQDMNSLIKILQNMSGTCTEVKEKKEPVFSSLLSELKVPLNFKSKLMLRFFLPNSCRGVREREACKSNIVKAMDNIRKGYQHLSKMMVTEGYLPDRELLFFMTIDEIQDLLSTRNPRLIARANQRRKLFPLLESIRFPEIIKGRPVPMNDENVDNEEYVADLTMKGVPVSQGYVKGYARVAISLEEASHLQPGEILITNSTDIGWSPYFPILAGVVTELGGLISHGAVVSREYGLPCVVGLHGATRKFMTGDYVLLDGNKGILQRLSSPEQ